MQRKNTGNSQLENIVSNRIIGAAIEVHKVPGGPGLLESVYEEALAYKLADQGMDVVRQKNVSITYKGRKLSTPLRLDSLVEKCVIVECKATTNYNSIFETQLLTYLRLTDLRLGLMINFGEAYVKNGLKRVPNHL